MNDKTATLDEQAPGAPRNIHQRLHEAMASVSYVQKDRKQGMQYSIVSHDKVTALVRPALHAAGIIYYPQALTHTQHGNRTEVALVVRFVNIDSPDDVIDVPSIGYGIDQQDKGPGKAISYAVKYALLKALGLETGDDPDHESIDLALAPADVAAHLAAISTAPDMDALKAAFAAGIDAARECHDATARDAFAKTKDMRKAELTTEAA